MAGLNIAYIAARCYSLFSFSFSFSFSHSHSFSSNSARGYIITARDCRFSILSTLARKAERCEDIVKLPRSNSQVVRKMTKGMGSREVISLLRSILRIPFISPSHRRRRLGRRKYWIILITHPGKETHTPTVILGRMKSRKTHTPIHTSTQAHTQPCTAEEKGGFPQNSPSISYHERNKPNIFSFSHIQSHPPRIHLQGAHHP
ncbi:hypothetical protein B0T24DRAFT_184887 [Lasiosphaeria ovina]|uniref:Uncharacterized protein n=1 Tax=Lasiosphaeria ovina TaxID=92902 RepID=A0AAE0TU31_9PEZI|nr:hypothetical protein B0T24DRAFT_184887 [Lasiosphaeria ovina]